MIPHDYVTEWRTQAPWVQDFQVEQDLAVALEETALDPERVIAAFLQYMEHGGHDVTRAQFERNIEAKLRNAQFNADIGPLLAAGFSWEREKAAESVRSRLIALLPGDQWKGDKSADGTRTVELDT